MKFFAPFSVAVTACMFAVASAQLYTDSLLMALNAALADYVNDGGLYSDLHTGTGGINAFDHEILPTCNPTASYIWPTWSNISHSSALYRTVVDGKLNVGAVGPVDFGVDGNYRITSPTGLFPEILGELVTRIRTRYAGEGTSAISINRTYFNTEAELRLALEDSTVYMTDVYTLQNTITDQSLSMMSAFVSTCPVLSNSQRVIQTTQTQASYDSFQVWWNGLTTSQRRMGALTKGDVDAIRSSLNADTTYVLYSTMTDLIAALTTSQSSVSAVVTSNTITTTNSGGTTYYETATGIPTISSAFVIRHMVSSSAASLAKWGAVGATGVLAAAMLM